MNGCRRHDRRQLMADGRRAGLPAVSLGLVLLAAVACGREPKPPAAEAAGPKVIVKAEPPETEAVPGAGSPTRLRRTASAGQALPSAAGGGGDVSGPVPVNVPLPVPVPDSPASAGESAGELPGPPLSGGRGGSDPSIPLGAGRRERRGESPHLDGRPGLLPDFAAIYEKCAPSVVKVTAWDARGPGPGMRPISFGAGFFFGRPGQVATNAHVAGGWGGNEVRFQVETRDGRTAEARVLRSDPEANVALLEAVIDRPPPPLPAAGEGGLKQGDWVLAIGNPLGLEFSASKGIVSALGRAGDPADTSRRGHLIQTDAPISRGSGGGPLLDVEGRVVGIAAAVEARADRIGFAIPVAAVLDIAGLGAREGAARGEEAGGEK